MSESIKGQSKCTYPWMHFYGCDCAGFQNDVNKTFTYTYTADPVLRPSHYTWIEGIECKEVTQHFNFNKGSAIKYIWRSGRKDCEIKDLKKAIESLNNELAMIESEK